MFDFNRMGLLEVRGSRDERKLQNLKFLPTVGFDPVTFHLRSQRAITDLRRLMSVE